MNFQFKKFFSYYKPYIGLFASVMLCSMAAAGISLVFPLLSRYITKTLLQSDMGNVSDEIVKVGMVMLGLIAVKAICGLYVDYKGHAMGAMMERDMRKELFEHYQKLSFRFYDEHKTGKLMTRITNDLLSLAELYHHGPEDYVIYLIKFIGGFAILFHINVKLTLAVMVFLPVMVFYSSYFNKKMRKALKKSWDSIGEVNAQVEDNLSGIRVVKSFANEAYEQQKFNEANDRFLDSRKNIYRNEAYFYNGMETFLQLITTTIVVYGAANILNAGLDLADLLTFLLCIGNIIDPIRALNHLARQFQEGVTCFGRFMEMLQIEPDIKDSEHAAGLKNVRGDVVFREVSFKYREDQDHVLNNIDLELEAGDYIALVGSSGIGKTTLCSLLPRFYEVTDGEILIDGQNIKDIRLDSLRKHIGVVQQDVYLFSGTGLENIRYGNLDASEDEIIEAAKNANAHDFIMKLPKGYHTDIGQRGVKLSGGQKQRLSIARAFLKNPPILIFDEATSSLDNESERVVQQSLEKLVQNRTTIVIAHRLSTVRNAKRIAVLTDRGITEQGTHEELLKLNGTYAYLHHLQTQ